jgi:hypothetical protein
LELTLARRATSLPVQIRAWSGRNKVY